MYIIVKFSMKASLASLALLGLGGLHQVSGHYGFPYLVVDGVITKRWEYVRGVKSFYPLENYSGMDAMCGIGASPSIFPVKTAKIAAGDTVGFAVGYSEGSAENREDEATNDFEPYQMVFHPGPATFWLSKAPSDDLDSYEGTGDWFKIDVIGSSDGRRWDIGDAFVISIINVTIPAATPPGKYLLRAEHLAMHYADSYAGAQMYPTCAQIEITGSGTGKPGPVVHFPGAFDAWDPAIWLPVALQHPTQPMAALKNWQGAGPAVWRG